VKRERENNMRILKKTTSILMALILALGCSFIHLQAYTYDETIKGEIIIQNPASSVSNYSFYRLFDVIEEEEVEPVLDADGNETGKYTGITYMIPNSRLSFFEMAYVLGYELGPKLNSDEEYYLTNGILDFTPMESVTVWGDTYNAEGYYVTATPGATDMQIRDYLEAALDHNKESTELFNLLPKVVPEDGDSYSENNQLHVNLPLGYYYIQRNGSSSLFSIATTNTASVVDKFETAESVGKGVVKITSSNGDELSSSGAAGIGDTITYQIGVDSQYTDANGKQIETYSINDMFENATYVDDSLTVTVGGKDISDDYYKAYINANSMISVQFEKWSELSEWLKSAGVTDPYISISYQLYLSTNSYQYGTSSFNISNTAVLHRSAIWLDAVGVDQPGYGIVIEKEDDSGNALNGAAFELYQTNTDDALSFIKKADGVYLLADTDDESNTTKLVTNSSGKLILMGLSQYDYDIQEITAPDGYSLNTEKETVYYTNHVYEDGSEENNVHPFTAVTLNNGVYSINDSSDGLDTKQFREVKIINSKNKSLPSTGGTGTKIFYAVGGLLVIGAAVFLLTNRRMRTEA
jgi:fimbrial isopeptide formation D2 family protein/LPXTG-motif cell wall-anchored protein